MAVLAASALGNPSSESKLQKLTPAEKLIVKHHLLSGKKDEALKFIERRTGTGTDVHGLEQELARLLNDSLAEINERLWLELASVKVEGTLSIDNKTTLGDVVAIFNKRYGARFIFEVETDVETTIVGPLTLKNISLKYWIQLVADVTGKSAFVLPDRRVIFCNRAVRYTSCPE